MEHVVLSGHALVSEPTVHTLGEPAAQTKDCSYTSYEGIKVTCGLIAKATARTKHDLENIIRIPQLFVKTSFD